MVTVMALAGRAAVLEWTRPELTEEARLAIEAGRHPIVERFSEARFIRQNRRVQMGRREQSLRRDGKLIERWQRREWPRSRVANPA